MQTFLPYADFQKSAECLDTRRLGKQRVECLQILSAIACPTYGWQNHPATNMWRGHIGALYDYTVAICHEWQTRGNADTCLDQATSIYLELPHGETPWWLGWREFHVSHQSNLIRKFPEHYAPLFPNIPNNLEYIWPPNVQQKRAKLQS